MRSTIAAGLFCALSVSGFVGAYVSSVPTQSEPTIHTVARADLPCGTLGCYSRKVDPNGVFISDTATGAKRDYAIAHETAHFHGIKDECAADAYAFEALGWDKIIGADGICGAWRADW